MDKFPAWAKPWLSPDLDQVNHGLNLALKLRSPAKLPLMLWDIVVAQPTIERALEDLSFLHFARFLPSWDGKALMVITSFDGPLEPYVMDFVIALGDVFDALLLYVEDAPPLPVREYPDEFWAFVSKWNRVPFAPRRRDPADLRPYFPASYDFPLYSSYAEKTVIDIAGERTKLPAPAIDHPGGHVGLEDVQVNILNGYKARAAVYLFYTVTNASAARSWLATVFAAGNAWGGVISATRWKREDKPALVAQLGFTYAGLETLLPDRRQDLERFPLAFREGALLRSEANGDVGPHDPKNWLIGKGDQGIHLMVVLYSSEARGPNKIARQFLARAGAPAGLQLLLQQGAHARTDSHEYFGYRDGVAQPRVSGQCKPDEPDFQPAASPGEFLLGKDYKSIFGGSSLGNLPEDLATNGTFGALRLIEQHVSVFKNMIKREAPRLMIGQDLLKAKLLGRWSNGEPLPLCPVGPGTDGYRNDFDYAPSWGHPEVFNDHDGDRCPVGAHIRRSNPRNARVAGQAHSRRLIRRGMPTRWREGGRTRRGLMGLFMGASLERQFEFIQQQWIQGGGAASGIRNTQDPLAGLRNKPTHMELPGIGGLKVPRLTTLRGSLYLFFPGIAMLRGLEKAAIAPNQPDRPAVPDRPRLSGLSRLPGPVIAAGTSFLLWAWHSEWLERIATNLVPLPRQDCSPDHPQAPGDIAMRKASFIANPFPAYEALRVAGRRVVWVKEHMAFWVLCREDAQRLFDEHEHFQQAPSGTKLRGIITMDRPRHAVVRGVAAEALQAATRDLDRQVDDAINSALADIGTLEHFDFMHAYGARVPRQILWNILGLPGGQIAACQRLVQTMIRHYGQPEHSGGMHQLSLYDASIRLGWRLGWQFTKAWLRSLIPFGKPRFAGTLIGELAARTKVTPFGLSFPPCRPLRFVEAVVTLVQFSLAGQSGEFLLGTATRNLLMPDVRPLRPRPWDALETLRAARNPTYEVQLRGALEEARRIDPPVTIAERYAAEDGLVVGGISVPKGSAVFAVIASANRDGVAGGNPEDFIWDRAPGMGHLSLGHGVHECVGKFVQSRIVPVALSRLLAAMPNLQLCDREATPAWVENVYFRTLLALPVKRCP